MAELETLGLLEEIQSLVSDQLQVVSYKWLSRNYLLSSNTAKRLLQKFVENYGSGLEIIYSVSGWLKSTPPNYHVRLVTGPKLSEAKRDFDGHCSVQVYSVQTCLPEDPAVLWNAEFLQAEELFKQPPSVENCLRDNRFCGVSNPFVKRNVDGKTMVQSYKQRTGELGQEKSNFTPLQLPQNKQQQSTPRVGVPSPSIVKDVKNENSGIGSKGPENHASKPPENKEKVPLSKKKTQNDKISTAGGSLANLWGRASVKSRPDCAPAVNSTTFPNPSVEPVEAQALPPQELGSSDDEGQHTNFKRSSNGEGGRKRRVVFDFSDEDEDATNLASPDSKNRQQCKDEQEEGGKRLNENISKEDGEPLKEVSSIITNKETTKSSEEKNQSSNPENAVNKKDSTTNATPGSPKRRKVLKTRIDERGREVTEVVWDGEEKETKKADDPATKKADATSAAVSKTVNRPPAAKKSPAMSSTTANPTGKAANKKGGNAKDPKQGNILSFFKKV